MTEEILNTVAHRGGDGLSDDDLRRLVESVARSVEKHELLLHGDDEQNFIGMVDQVDRLNTTIYGDGKGKFGIAHQFKLVWRSYVWVLMTLSAGTGAVFWEIAGRWFRKA